MRNDTKTTKIISGEKNIVNIAYVSNFMNHHQLPFSKEMLSLPSIQYNFVSLTPVPQERLDMGYEDMNHRYSFVLCAYDSTEKMQKAKKIIDDADIAIFGSCPDAMILKRAKQGKICCKFSERYFKNGTVIHNFFSAMKHLKPFEKLPLYFGCSSAYTAADLNRYTKFVNRTFKWGYFPETKIHDINSVMTKKNSVISNKYGSNYIVILWVGRFIEWKHPEAAIQLAAALKAKGYAFKLQMIGNGTMEAQLKKMIKQMQVTDCTEMLGSMPPNKVRKYMEAADIFLFTSDYNEGWGAVLNESMNSGCAVVASHAIGSVPFLIEDGKNGLVYKSGQQQQLERQVCRLMDNKLLRQTLGMNAYQSIISLWNAGVAANRFVELAKVLQDGENALDLFKDGPCSKAEILKDGWYHNNEN